MLSIFKVILCRNTAKSVVFFNNNKRPILLMGLLLVLSLFSGFTLAGVFLIKGSLSHDVLSIFSIFRDNLHSLNYFGEIAWWNPSMSDNGFPMYYLSILGDNLNSPLFASIGFAVWCLGKLNIYISSYHDICIYYYMFLVPFLFTTGLLLVARQVFKNIYTLIFIIILSSFSPGILFNLVDRGFEQNIYSLFFIAAWLNFIKKTTKSSFFLLATTTLLLAISFSHLSLYWNIYFCPIAVFTTITIREKSTNFKKIFSKVPLYYWLGLIIAVFICFTPLLAVNKHGSESIFRSVLPTQAPKDENILDRSGHKMYSFNTLASGNPLQILSSGTPGVGFNWNGPYSLMRFTGEYIAYGYLGIMTLPFLVVGLIFGKNPWKCRLFLIFFITSCITLLSQNSPTFALVLAWPTPLRSVRHYSDASFRLGIFYIMILISGLGFEIIVKFYKKIFWRAILFISFVLSILLSIFLIVITRLRKESLLNILNEQVVSLYIVLAFFATILVISLFFIKNKKQQRLVVGLILFFMFIDLSTNSFYYVRFSNNIWDHPWNNKTLPKEPSVTQIGFRKGDPRAFIANTILKMKSQEPPSSYPKYYLALLNQGLPKWENILDISSEKQSFNNNEEGKMIIENGAYVPTSSYISLVNDDLRDFRVDIEADFSRGGGGIWLRSKLENGKISGILLKAEEGRMSWHIVKEGNIGVPYNLLPIPELAGKIHLSIDVTWNTYVLSINKGDPRMRMVDDNFCEGRIALYAQKPGSKYYHVRILNNFIFPGKNVKIMHQTYNQLHVEVETEKEDILFWNDAYFPFWEAAVNGEKVEILKIDNGKGVRVPSGKSIVSFVFKPNGIPCLYLLSYIMVFICIICYFLNIFKFGRKLQKYNVPEKLNSSLR